MTECRDLEAFLARLYTDEKFRGEFLSQPEITARRAGLSDVEASAVMGIDRVGLQMAVKTFAFKRKSLGRSWWERILGYGSDSSAIDR